MKKLILPFLFLAALTFSANAQKVDVSVSLSSPTPGTKVVGGQAFLVSYTIKNEDKTLVTGDSILIAFKLNTGWLVDSASGNINVFVHRVPNNWAKGATIGPQNINFRLIDNGSIPANFDFCAALYGMRGPSGADTNPSNDDGCANVDYSATAGTGAVYGIALHNPINLFNGQLNINLENPTLKGPVDIEIVDLNGRRVFHKTSFAEGGLLYQTVNISHLDKAIYILRINGEMGLILNQKLGIR